MGNLLVGAIILAAALHAVRTVHAQKKRMKDWKCTGDCGNCQMPCRVKSIYRRETPGSK